MARVGHITHMYGKADPHGNVVLDGTCRVHNDITGQDWFGRLILLSGGNVVFSLTDDRGTPITAGQPAAQAYEVGQGEDATPFAERPGRRTSSARGKEKSTTGS